MAIKNKIVVNPATPKARGIIEKVTTEGLPSNSTVIYKGRRNTLVSINCIDGAIDNATGLNVNVKAFRIPPFPNDYVYRSFREGKAKRSYYHALKLLERGFLTPTPLGYSECRQGIGTFGKHGLWLRLTRSYYFCEQIPYRNFREWEKRDDIDRLLPAFGAEIARIHNAKIWFHDFSPGNIMANEIAPGEYQFYYVDLNRMDFDIDDEHKLMQMFKSITFDDKWVESLARAYAAAAGKDADRTTAMALDAAHTYRERHERKERIKRLLHKNHRR